MPAAALGQPNSTKKVGLKDLERRNSTLLRCGNNFLYSLTQQCEQHGDYLSPARRHTPFAPVSRVALPITTSMSFSNISGLCPHNEHEEDDLHCTNEEVSLGAGQGGCLRTHRKPVTEAGNWTQTVSSSWVPSPSWVADKSPLLLGLWNLSLVGFTMNFFFFFFISSSHYVSLHSHFCFVKAFDPASFLFWLKNQHNWTSNRIYPSQFGLLPHQHHPLPSAQC